MQEQRDRLATGVGELARKPVELLGFGDEARVHHQRVQANEAPACGVEAPAVVTKDCDEGLSAFLAHELGRNRPDLGRIVADVVISG